ncbi:hypothetical protein [Nitratireductor thuwali]|uniref:Uncharacterized protein n=1 Tax=Nitratireductor thuwali TaxID=2267699 RepID=A0ABY5MNA8_9HYPH|nr:hypothetical protein NTH_03981 [Nitratireductor thuwali]
MQMKVNLGQALMAMGVAILTHPAVAADAGWGVQFHYDAFEDQIYPMGAMGELKEQTSIDRANLFLACKDGTVGVIFQPTRFSFDSGGVTARFRAAEGVQEFRFDAVEFPAFGKHRAIHGPDAQKFLEIFATSNAPVAFQTDDIQGNFPVAGFAEVRAIMQEHCNRLQSN